MLHSNDRIAVSLEQFFYILLFPIVNMIWNSTPSLSIVYSRSIINGALTDSITGTAYRSEIWN